MSDRKDHSVNDMISTAEALSTATPKMLDIAKNLCEGKFNIPYPGLKQTHAINILINQLPIAPFEMAKKQMIAHAEATLKNTSDKAAVADTVLNTQLGRWAAAKGAKAAGLSMGVPFAGDVASKALLDPTIGKMIGKGATFISQGTKTINESGGVKGGIQSITQAIEKQFKSADKSSEKTSLPSAPTNNKPKQP